MNKKTQEKIEKRHEKATQKRLKSIEKLQSGKQVKPNIKKKKSNKPLTARERYLIEKQQREEQERQIYLHDDVDDSQYSFDNTTIEEENFDEDFEEYSNTQTSKREKHSSVIHKVKFKKAKKPPTKKKKKLIHFIAYSCIFLGVLIVATILCLTVLFKTENIVVIDNTKYLEQDIIDSSDVDMGENIFMACLTMDENKMLAQYPYIKSIKATVKLPSTVQIVIEEQKPADYFEISKNNYCIVASDGSILEKCSNAPKNIPLIKGLTPTTSTVGETVSFKNSKNAKILEQIITSVEKNAFEPIRTINLTNTAKIKINYDGRITVVIGLPQDIDYKIRTAIAIINDKLDPNNTGTVSGTLDVSECNTTKRSYFNEKSVISTKATEPSTQATSETAATTNYQETTAYYEDTTAYQNTTVATYATEATTAADTKYATPNAYDATFASQ